MKKMMNEDDDSKRWYVGLAYGLAGGWGMLIGLLQLGVGLVMVSSGWGVLV